MKEVAALALCVLASGCMDWGDLAADDVEVPPGLAVSDAAYQVAYAFAANRVGPIHFGRLYEVNTTATGPARLGDCQDPECPPLARLPHGRVVFDLRLPDGTRHAAAEIAVWPNGTVALDDHPDSGLPDCRQRPASCRFFVDAGEARRAARHEGLEARGCDLTASIGWSAHLERFVWQVDDRPCPEPQQSSARVVLVDHATGRVVGTSGWSSIAD